jgi:hypothetical protein
VRFLLYPQLDAAVIPSMLLFAVAYVVLLLPRSANDMVYDRYMLPIMPCVLFPILLGYQRQGDRRVPVAAMLLFSIYTLYGIAITQDVTALGRARIAAVNLLLNDKNMHVLPGQIDAGFEYDFQTQLDTYGYINDRRIRIPKGAYKDGVGPTYAIQPLYRLEFNSAPDTIPTGLGPVPYFSYLYPFHRKIYIDAWSDPWWLNPRKAATRPADRYHRFIAPTALDDQN